MAYHLVIQRGILKMVNSEQMMDSLLVLHLVQAWVSRMASHLVILCTIGMFACRYETYQVLYIGQISVNFLPIYNLSID